MLLNILLSMRHKEDDLLQHCFARWGGVPAARVGNHILIQQPKYP
jgi:hypothetical protein